MHAINGRVMSLARKSAGFVPISPELVPQTLFAHRKFWAARFGVGADASDPRARREGTGLVAASLQWHLARALRSLPLVERGWAG